MRTLSGKLMELITVGEANLEWKEADMAQLFEEKGAEIYCVELVAPQEIRLERNVTENRLKHKASKRDLEFSRNTLLDADRKHRIESVDGEVPFENYMRIDNSQMEPADVAAKIKEKFAL